ncbi:MAG: hypothetical protein ACYC0Y_27650 [Pirellulales bacterium]
MVGKLHRLWSWFDRQTLKGNAHSVTFSWVDRYLGVSGFADAMAAQGWLEQSESGLRLPKFDRHNGQTAKGRALTAKRVAAYKTTKGNAASVTDALPREEKRREDISKRTSSLRSPRGAKHAPADLLALIDGWNALDKSIVKNRVTREPIPQAVLAGWDRTKREPELREALSDVPALVAAIRRACFCHEQGWFTLPWLLGKGKTGELNAKKLLNGAYDHASGTGKPHPKPGPGQVYDPTAATADTF